MCDCTDYENKTVGIMQKLTSAYSLSKFDVYLYFCLLRIKGLTTLWCAF
jgi:hypothetical protein